MAAFPMNLTPFLFTSAALLGQASSQPASSASAKLSNEDQNIRAYIELLRSDVQKSKVQVMSDVTQFDADEALTFWPIYKEFRAELTRNDDAVSTLIKK